MQKAVVGVLVAAVIAVVVSGGSVAGIAAWKIALAAVGLGLFVLGGRGRR